jgi:hypothetical protein
MSYEIVYDKQFVRIPQEGKDRFIPIILSGSNNCYEYNNRRARNWFTFQWIMPNKKLSATEVEMLERIEEWKQSIVSRYEEGEPDVDKYFGYWASLAIGGSTRNTTYGMTQGIVKTGVKKSLTIEQLANEHTYVNVSTGYYAKESLIENNLEQFSITPKTTEELVNALEKAESYNRVGVPIEISINLNTYDGAKWLRRKFFTKNRRDYDYETVDHFFTVEMPAGYLVKRTRNGYRYTYYPYLKYKKESEARRRAKTSGGIVKRIDEEARVKVFR